MFELSGERELCEECAPALQLLKDGGALIMRCITFADLKKALEECLSTSSANALLYFVGERCGIRSYQRLKWIYQERTTLLEAAARLKWDELWGDFSFDLDQNGTGTVYIRDSFEARGYGPSKEPVCYFIKGYLTGLLSQAFNRDLRLTETECAARGDRRCTFQSRPNPSGSPR